MNPQDYTVIQLRELLKAKDLSILGNKADLILRLQDHDPEIWDKIAGEEELNTSPDPPRDTEPRQSNTREEGSAEDRELELLRREIELMRQCAKPRNTASKSTDARPDESAGKTSKAASEANLIQPFVGSEPYTVSVMYSAPDDEGNTKPFSCVAIVDTGSPISLIKPNYAPVNCRTSVSDNDFRFNGLNNSRIKILGIFERHVEVNGIDVNIKFYVVPDETMSSLALLRRDFTSNPAVKIAIDQIFEVVRNEADSSVNTDNFAEQFYI
ncbi:hypothetical protein ALC62_01466 [Cyphomyrmex costatus]|uniref:SAP domain-containing protein n=1 Tax=Cyphomyrmex costatus TaxID=456900 RepID=A0A151IP78_9HYME|nr:hypothetical protein ALC62_01466 [Cyphomyrmex costatus]